MICDFSRRGEVYVEFMQINLSIGSIPCHNEYICVMRIGHYPKKRI